MSGARFEFFTANQIVFGCGVIQDLGTVAKKYGKKALLVSGMPRPEMDEVVRELLEHSGVKVKVFRVAAEPTREVVGAALEEVQGCEVVIGLGGGSAMDTAKAVAALATNGGELFDYLEVVGKGLAITQIPLPCIAIPTTAGTGSEVTRNAVIDVRERGMKASLRSPMMVPRVAVVDPELTFSLPPAVTAATGMDAITQLIEPLVSNRANPLTDAICREGLRLAAPALRRAVLDGKDAVAREAMSAASLMGGMALANARLGAVHGFAAPLGGMTGAAHGAICASLLPAVMKKNIARLIDQDSSNFTRERYTEIGQILTGNHQSTAEDGTAWVLHLCRELGIPRLRDLGLVEDQFEELAQKAAIASSMQGNPVKLSHAELLEIIQEAY